MRIAVGSKNPVKLEAVRQGFKHIWGEEDHEILAVAAVSGVPDQPMSDEEMIRGARNRARGALKETGADFGVGLEGGLHGVGGCYFDCGWIVVLDNKGNEGIGSTAKILTPPSIVELVLSEGLELGEANDRIFNVSNSKQEQGHFGLMTNNAITRESAYRDAVIVALSRFLHPHLF